MDIMCSDYALIASLRNVQWTTSTVWPTANMALLVPVHLDYPAWVYQLSVTNGAAVSGNIDVGIYDEEGVLLVSAGSTAQTGVSVAQFFNVTDTLLMPGVYFLAVALNNTTGALNAVGSSVITQVCTFVCEATSAFALPNPITIGTRSTRTFIPIITAHLHSVV